MSTTNLPGRQVATVAGIAPADLWQTLPGRERQRRIDTGKRAAEGALRLFAVREGYAPPKGETIQFDVLEPVLPVIGGVEQHVTIRATAWALPTRPRQEP